MQAVRDCLINGTLGMAMVICAICGTDGAGLSGHNCHLSAWLLAEFWNDLMTITIQMGRQGYDTP